jgi:dTDP-4-amino-4,6-dideoxygalactose transaminase
MSSALAIFAGPKAVVTPVGDTFTWPIISPAAEQAALDVLRRGAMSGIEISVEFEKEYAAWQGTRYALAHSSGTAAIEGALFGCGVRQGDEVIVPSLTYWASALPAFNLKASIVFAEVQPETLCLDPADLEHRITRRTKAIVVVHYCGYPADMDPIMAIARKHGIKVLEDVSHAHGGVYRGRKLGSLGDVAAMSLMSGKALAIGEGGMLATDDRDIYEYAVAWGHYERYNNSIQCEALRPCIGLPLGGHKYRMHQVSSAVGRVQLREYDQRNLEILKAMNAFWDQLEGVPGIRAHRPAKGSGCEMGGWYAAHGLYRPEELGGLSITRFCQAVSAEGVSTSPGCNRPLHLHPLLNTCDVYGDGKPTRLAHSPRNLCQDAGSLPVTELMNSRVYGVPWFKFYRPAIIAEHATAFRKVAENYRELLADDPGDAPSVGGWGLFARR